MRKLLTPALTLTSLMRQNHGTAKQFQTQHMPCHCYDDWNPLRVWCHCYVPKSGRDSHNSPAAEIERIALWIALLLITPLAPGTPPTMWYTSVTLPPPRTTSPSLWILQTAQQWVPFIVRTAPFSISKTLRRDVHGNIGRKLKIFDMIKEELTIKSFPLPLWQPQQIWKIFGVHDIITIPKSNRFLWLSHRPPSEMAHKHAASPAEKQPYRIIRILSPILVLNQTHLFSNMHISQKRSCVNESMFTPAQFLSCVSQNLPKETFFISQIFIIACASSRDLRIAWETRAFINQFRIPLILVLRTGYHSPSPPSMLLEFHLASSIPSNLDGITNTAAYLDKHSPHLDHSTFEKYRLLQVQLSNQSLQTFSFRSVTYDHHSAFESFSLRIALPPTKGRSPSSQQVFLRTRSAVSLLYRRTHERIVTERNPHLWILNFEWSRSLYCLYELYVVLGDRVNDRTLIYLILNRACLLNTSAGASSRWTEHSRVTCNTKPK